MVSLHSLLSFSGLASAAAAVLNLAGWAQYLRAQTDGLSRSSPVNWLVFLMLAICAWSIQSRVSTPMQALLYGTSTLLCLAVFLRSLRNPWAISSSDAVLLGLSLALLLALWREPRWAVAIMATYYLGNYASFAHKIVRDATEESPAAWGIWVAASACLLLAQPRRDPLAWTLPGVNFACTLAVLAAITWSRRVVRPA